MKKLSLVTKKPKTAPAGKQSRADRPGVSIFDKCRNFTRARDMEAIGLYPYFHRVESAQEPEVICEGKPMVMMSSNNYLGLTSHPKVVEASIEATRKFGTGCAGSRFLNGTLALHEELEGRLAAFFRKDAAIIFPTGFQANLGAISSLVSRDDVVIIDRLNHACIFDGCRLSYGQIRKFRHSDMEDLERVLDLNKDRNMLVVVDGVFSMEGDIAPLPEMVRLTRKYGAGLMVDDAHGIGVLGAGGRGTAEHFGVENDVDIIMGTYSKSLASIGGCIAGDSTTIEYLKHHARSLIYSASLPPSNTAAVLAALDIVENEPERREKLWSNSNYIRDGLKSLGLDTLETETPIIPVLIGDDMLALQFWRELFDRGLFATPVIPPAVPKGMSLIRTSCMATHTHEHLDRALEAFEQVGRKLGVIGKDK
jgi:8-amino-7-oxononanoate synthase